jgi:hypothetical protein
MVQFLHPRTRGSILFCNGLHRRQEVFPMRFAILVLCLCASTAAFCQTAIPSPATSCKPSQTLLFTPQASRYAVIHRPIQADQFDAKMIVHPPQSSIGVLPPGIPVARNLYPDLQLQFIGQTSTARLEIPIYWPNLSIEPIPIAWPKLKAVPAQDSTAAVATPPAK